MGEALGAQSSLCGGGRYDYLIEEIGGPPTPGVGFASGIERIVLLARSSRASRRRRREVDVFFAVEDDDVAAGRARRRWPSCGARAARPTPTTRAAR